MGPGLVKIFGIETATELLPYKGLSVFIGFLFAPLGYLILNSMMDPFQYLFLLSFYSLISVFLAFNLYKKYGQNSNPWAGFNLQLIYEILFKIDLYL